MPETRKRTRSVSNELDTDGEYDDHLHDDENLTQQSGKPGRKKNPNSQAARRDQNRIAQREFRLRKQQRIRDLEARVELLSGTKDETYYQMREIVRELIAENHTLRTLLKGVSAFIGDGAGGCLPTMGWSLKEFDAFINKADTDTAFEAFIRRKKAKEQGLMPTLTNNNADAAGENAPRKRSRGMNGFDGGVNGTDFATSVNANSFFDEDTSAMGLFHQSIRPAPTYSSNFLNELSTNPQNGAAFLPSGMGYPTPPTASTPSTQDSFSAPPYSTDPTHSPQTAGPSSLQDRSFLVGMPASQQGNPQTSTAITGNPDEPVLEDPKEQEARKLIAYHLENYRRNSAYCLPPSLRPTLVQRTVEHEGIIDSILHPEIRNRMILLRGRFNLVDCIHDYLNSTLIHGDDVLAHSNWEIKEDWLKRYGFLVDPTTLALTNHWRKERGAAEINITDIAPSNEQIPGVVGL